MTRTEDRQNPFEKMLRAQALRITPARLQILNILARAAQPLSAEELYAQVRRSRNARADLATLYRNVKTFEEKGLISPIDLGTGRTFYELKSARPHHHHHVICEGCQKIEHLDVCGIEPHLKALAKMGYKKVHHKLEFSGICKTCG